jgi:hypothetical protein
METFQGGVIYWSSSTGAHVVYGGIDAKYNSLGGPVGYGLPTSDEAWVAGVPGVRVTDFQNGADLYWSAATGAHAVYGAIGAEYTATAHETDAYGTGVQRILGAPTSDEMNVPGVAGARMNTFQGGAIYWSPGTGAHVVYGGIGAKYNSLGGPAGYGLPVSDEANVPGLPGVRVTDFQNGADLYWSAATGAHAVYGAIGMEYTATANETDCCGRDVQALLGAPTSDEMDVPGVPGTRMNTFQGGAIYWSPGTGAHVVYGGIGTQYNSLGGPTSSLGLPTSDEQGIPGGRVTYFQNGKIAWVANPAASTTYSPAPAGAPLFNNGGPSYLDVEQGQVGDCWLMASLAEVAARDPQDITNMFTYDGTTVDNGATVGLYTVRFFDASGSPFYVEADTQLPSAGEYYDHVDNALGTQALWVALAEKAYAEANGLGYVTTSQGGQDSYDALNGGWPSWALQAITGRPAGDYSINSTDLASDWNSGDLIVLCTSTPASSFIVGSHCYAVVGYDATSGLPFEVFNPWGTDSSGWAPGYSGTIYGLFTADAAFISQNFTTQSLGTGAINVNDLAAPADELAGLATLGDGYATSGTINITRYRLRSSVVGAETATFHLGKRMDIGYTRPAQGTALGVDLGVASDAGDGDYPTTSRLRARRIGGW